jgi:hypothetical protein
VTRFFLLQHVGLVPVTACSSRALLKIRWLLLQYAVSYLSFHDTAPSDERINLIYTDPALCCLEERLFLL